MEESEHKMERERGTRKENGIREGGEGGEKEKSGACPPGTRTAEHGPVRSLAKPRSRQPRATAAYMALEHRIHRLQHAQPSQAPLELLRATQVSTLYAYASLIQLLEGVGVLSVVLLL